jgi:hypothetical protein
MNPAYFKKGLKEVFEAYFKELERLEYCEQNGLSELVARYRQLENRASFLGKISDSCKSTLVAWEKAVITDVKLTDKEVAHLFSQIKRVEFLLAKTWPSIKMIKDKLDTAYKLLTNNPTN